MAEQVAAARMAAQIGCQASGPSADLLPDRLRVAVAKSRTSEAAGIVAPMAHAIHGAIGNPQDYLSPLLGRVQEAGSCNRGVHRRGGSPPWQYVSELPK